MSDPFTTEEYKNDKFRNSKGAFRITSLFIDYNYDYETAQYTWKDYDFKNEKGEFPSLKRLYLLMEDVTEYNFACTYLGGWQHWKALLNSPVVRKHIDEWREELELKLMARGIDMIVQMASDPESNSIAAAKYLADKQWIDKRRSGEKAKIDRQRKAVKSARKGDLDRVAQFIPK